MDLEPIDIRVPLLTVRPGSPFSPGFPYKMKSEKNSCGLIFLGQVHGVLKYLLLIQGQWIQVC